MARAKESVKYSYDIFFSISHRDRNNTDYVYKALVDSGLRIFRDGDPIERSEDIKSEVKKVIELSRFCIVVLSKSYTSSKWCLDQLVMMIECKRNEILSLFYDQKGRIGEGFARYEEQLKVETDYQRKEKLMDKIQGWSDAVSFASDLPGFVLQNQADRDESKFIDYIQMLIEVIKEEVKVVQEDFVPMEAETEGGLLNHEPSSLVEEWTATEINLRDIEELPENPNYPFLVKLVLEQSHDLMEIPDSFFESMPVLQVLDLSNTSIKTLPRSITSLAQLRQFFLRDCILLRELPPEIGELKKLEVFDLEGTELMCLPEEIRGLLQLECLKVSLYRYADNYIERKGIKVIIPRATLSKCSHLKELSILVDPDCEWWDAEVEAIINELPQLRNLGKLELYFPTLELLQKFLQLPHNVYQNLSNFRLIVGRHEQHIISSLPHNLQSEFEKLKKCLKYVNGKGNVDGIGKALGHARALFLDRQWTIEKLSAFKIGEMHQLNFCLVVECNEMNTIVDGGDFYQECDNGGKSILGSLRYLSVHYMKNLQSIWKGPIVSHCLSSLEILALHTCPKLTTVFNLALLCNLISLKELIVENCPKVKILISADTSHLGADSDFLPALQKILIVDLPELVSISGGLRFGHKLESIFFSNCPMLKNLSPTDICSKYMHEIKDESEWSKALDSSSSETDYLQRVLVPLKSYCDPTEQQKNSGKPLYQPPSQNKDQGSLSSPESQLQETSGNSQIYGTSRQTSEAAAANLVGSQGAFSSYRSSGTSVPVGYYAVQKENVFPERPGQPECQFYMRTGDCKFGAVCRFHHPRERLIPAPDCVLNPIGLPFRPGEPFCIFYSRYGFCKYGPICKFDHPMGVFIYNRSVSSSSEAPALRLLASSPSLTSGLSLTSKGLIEAGGGSGKSRWPSLSENTRQTPSSGENKNIGAVGKFHHPRERLIPAPECVLSPIGLPFRPGEPLCKFYAACGFCKFGSNCKFNHPMGAFTYNQPVSSSSEAPVRH